LASHFDILSARHSTLLLKGVKHVDGIIPLRDIDDTPFAQNMDTDFLDARANGPHRLPIAWLQSVLNSAEFGTGASTSLVGEIPEVFQTRPYEFQRLCHHV
jgi:hypothetical protein